MIGDQFTDIQFAKKSGIKGFLFKEKNLYAFIKSKKYKKINFNKIFYIMINYFIMCIDYFLLKFPCILFKLSNIIL